MPPVALSAPTIQTHTDEVDYYEQLAPNEQGRFYLQELNVELVFEVGLIHVYKDNKKIPTLKEALRQA